MGNSVENEIKDIDYSLRGIFSFKKILILIIVSSLIIVNSIPFKDKVDSIIYGTLTNIPGCKINFSSYEFSYFLPKIIFKDLNFAKGCFGLSRSMSFSKSDIYILGPSLYPFGFAFRTQLKYLNSKVDAEIITGISELTLLMETTIDDRSDKDKHNIIDISDFKNLVQGPKLKGKIYLSNIFANIGYNGAIKDTKINIASKNLIIPTQTISIVNIQKIELGPVLLQAEMVTDSKLKLVKLTVGDDKSPIIAHFTGDIKFNKRNINHSPLNFRGELGLSEDFQEKYSWTNLVFSSFDKKDKFYQIEVKGNLESPIYRSAR